MRYYITTRNGILRNDKREVISFDNSTDATHYAINYCDLCDKDLMVIKF